MFPLVSVIITCFNYGEYLEECIKSVFSQSYRPIEVIVVDDGSTDSTPIVCSHFATQITVIKHDNVGVVISRNEAAKIARGEYLLFLDADNFLHTDAILNLQRVLSNTPNASFSYGAISLIGELEGQCSPPNLNWLGIGCLHIWNFIDATALIRRSAFLELNGFEVELNRDAVEDWELWLRLINRGYRGVRANGISHYYRVHLGSRSTLYRGSKRVVKQAEKYVRQKYFNKITILQRVSAFVYLAVRAIVGLRFYSPYVSLTLNSNVRYLLNKLYSLLPRQPDISARLETKDDNRPA